jgi:Ca-activated chloride channel family protein
MSKSENAGVKVGLKLEKQRVAAGGDTRLYGAVTLTAPRYVPEQRPPLDLVACIDVSGSMAGRKLDEAKLAVKQLVTNLDAQDRLAVVSFTNDARLVSALTPATREGKSALTEAVEELAESGSTNMSAGTALSLELLQGAARQVDGKEALRRVIVFTDGHANAGINERDRKGWGELFEKQLGDASVSWFGFGEDHDAHFLSDLADLTKGNSYVAKDADAIGVAFAQELGSLIGIVAKELRLQLRGLHGAAVVLNDEKLERDGDAVIVTLADLTSQEVKPIVFELPVKAGALGDEAKVLEVDVSWLDVRTQAKDAVSLAARVSFVDAAEADKPDASVLEPVAVQKGARAQKEAATLVESGDVTRGEALLRDAAAFAAGIGTPEGDRIAKRLTRLAGEYGDVAYYRAHRSEMKSIQRSSSKGRASGSRLDRLYMTCEQVDMVAAFGKELDLSDPDEVSPAPGVMPPSTP